MLAQGIAGSPRAAPRTRLEDGLSPIIQDYQPVLSLLTQGVNVHATRLDALARIVQRLDKQREEAEEHGGWEGCSRTHLASSECLTSSAPETRAAQTLHRTGLRNVKHSGLRS